MIGIGSKNKAADFFKMKERAVAAHFSEGWWVVFGVNLFVVIRYTDSRLSGANSQNIRKFALRYFVLNEVVDIIVDDASVARLHCAFVHSSSSSFVFDLGSPSGTFLNGKRIAPHEPEMLSEGSEVRVSEKSQTTLVLKGLPLSKWQPPAWSKMPWSPAALFGRLPGADEFVSESRLSDQKLKKRERAEADLSSSQFGSLVRTSVLQKTPSQTERSATGASESDVGDAFTAAKAEPAAAADAGRSGKTNADFRALLNSPVTLPKGMRKGAIEGKAALRKVQ
eukprot:gene3807-4760_t